MFLFYARNEDKSIDFFQGKRIPIVSSDSGMCSGVKKNTHTKKGTALFSTFPFISHVSGNWCVSLPGNFNSRAHREIYRRVLQARRLRRGLPCRVSFIVSSSQFSPRIRFSSSSFIFRILLHALLSHSSLRASIYHRKTARVLPAESRQEQFASLPNAPPINYFLLPLLPLLPLSAARYL